MQTNIIAKLYGHVNIFCAVVECGTFTQAASKLGLAQSNISKKIKLLEEHLGYQLIMRNTRSTKITTEGLKLYDFFIQQQQNFTEYMQSQQVSKYINTKVRLALPEVISYFVVTPYIAEFQQQHPDIELEVYYQHREFNFTQEKFDLAVVNHIPNHQKIMLKFLGKQKLYLYCTPQYIERYGLVTKVEQLSSHLYTGAIDHKFNVEKAINFTSKQEGEFIFDSASRLYLSSMMSAKQLSLSGHAISGGFEILFAEELRNGTMIKLLPDFAAGEMSHYLIRRPQADTQTIKCVAKFIENCFEKISAI